MLPHELKDALEQQYKLECFCDLADLAQARDAVFKIFNECYKESFAPNERLVFYSKDQPSADLLEHIKKAADIIDISRFFILICSPTPFELDGMQHYSCQVESNPVPETKFALPDTICPLPWLHLEINPAGEVSPCCVANHAVGNATDTSLTDIFFNEEMSQLRADFLQGKQPEVCSHCWKLEKYNLPSNREFLIKYYAKQFYSRLVDQPKIRSLDVKPGNVCNFKCRVCNPMSSSLVADERLRNATDTAETKRLQVIIDQGRWQYNNETFKNQVVKLLPDLEALDIYGGEPFLLKDLPEFLKTAVDTGRAPHIKLHFNSNGSIFPKNLMPLFKQFKSVDIALSIDNTGSRFEFERGGTWPEVESNIRQYLTYADSTIHPSIWTTVNIQNVLYLGELMSWADAVGIKVNLNFLAEPKYLCIDWLTPVAQQLVVDRYQNHAKESLRNLAERVKNGPGSDGQEFVEYMKKLDSWRKENFADTHKEIAIAMGYTV